MTSPRDPLRLRQPTGPAPPLQRPPFSSAFRWLVPLALLLLLWAAMRGTAERPEAPDIEYSTFYTLVEQGKVESVTLRGRDVSGMLRAPATIDDRKIQRFETRLPELEDAELLPLLRRQNVKVEVRGEGFPFGQILILLLPWALIIGLWIWLSRRAQKMMMGAGGPMAGFTKSRARRYEKKEHVETRFEDVAGLAAAKRDLGEVVDFLKRPDQFRRLGGKSPRGVLLVGPPGTGKTLLARAVAGEAGVPFFSIGGSEFIELFVGVGASRVRELFEAAKKEAPAIVFIDEIDAVGRARGAGLGGGHDEREQTLNQLLSEMDGFTRNDNVIVLAATNRPDVLDPALLRPGRFDRRVMLERPEKAARLAILQVHLRDKPMASDVALEDIADETPGFSGADLANLVNEAVLNATRRGADQVAHRDFRQAYDKIVLGEMRESKLTPEEKRRVCLHEAGHAVVAHFTPRAEALRRITVIPRGISLGATQQVTAEDRHIATQEELTARLRVLLGGYAAERLLTGEVSTGAENDLKQATELAYKMVAHYGMSEMIGPVYHEHRAEHPFLGQRLATDAGVSDRTVHLIEEEARKMLISGAAAAELCITENREAYDQLVSTLLDKETIERDELTQILGPQRRARAAGTTARKASAA